MTKIAKSRYFVTEEFMDALAVRACGSMLLLRYLFRRILTAVCTEN